MLQRRHLLALGLGAMTRGAGAQTHRTGRLLAIGGAEDRLLDRVILRQYLALCGGPDACIVVLTAASADPAATWASYEEVFRHLGARRCVQVDVREPAEANDPARVGRLLEADGIFMTGGDQRRLMAALRGSEAARAMHTAFHLRGSCIAGTSAGAAVLSRHMLAEGQTPPLPEKGAAVLDLGLGFIPVAIVDQHFSERRRLGRLLSVIAQRPDLLGLGIDENTALLIERGRSIEVFGQGAVTLIDGQQMRTNLGEAGPNETLEMLDVHLHLLPAGHRYSVVPGEWLPRRMPASLLEAVTRLVAPSPILGDTALVRTPAGSPRVNPA